MLPQAPLMSADVSGPSAEKRLRVDPPKACLPAGHPKRCLDYDAWNVANLKAECRVRHLTATGTKQILIDRIEANDDVIRRAELRRDDEVKEDDPGPAYVVKDDRIELTGEPMDSASWAGALGAMFEPKLKHEEAQMRKKHGQQLNEEQERIAAMPPTPPYIPPKARATCDTTAGGPASVDATAGSPASVDAPLDAGSPVFGFGRAAMAWDMDVQDTQPRGDLVLALHSEDVQGDLVEPVTCLEKDEKASDGETSEPTISPYSVCGKCGRHILFSEECAFRADGTASNQNGTKVEKAEKTDRGSLAQASFQAAVAAWHNRPRHPVEPVEEPKQIRKTVPSD